MFREFNVKFEDVEMIGGTDNLLENTEITKVIVRGDSKMSSLDSTFKNCKELDTIDGELDLNGVSDIDNLLENTELVKSISLKNINNENISANNSFPHIEEMNIGGELYNKKAIQNVIASKEWTFDNITYSGTVGDNVVTKETNINDNNKVTIQDTLEQKVRGFEIIGQTYENLVVGSGEVALLDELALESIDGSPNEFNPHIEQPVCVETIEGETYQNLVNGKEEYKLTDTFSTTWTENDNSIDNPPSMIEISEIWGNTIQDETDLSNIQSLGDLYVDEEGNEQYKLEIESSTVRTNLLSENGKLKFSHGQLNSSGSVNVSNKQGCYTDYFIKAKLSQNQYYHFFAKDNLNINCELYRVFMYDKDKNFLGHLGNNGSIPNGSKTNIVRYNNVEYIKIGLFNYTSGTVLDLDLINSASFCLAKSDVTEFSDDYSLSNKTTILLPQQLKGLSDVKDRLFYDYTKNMYVIENKIGDFNNINDLSEAILSVPKMIETKALEKLSLETYLPKTYISTNTEVQPSQMTINNKKILINLKELSNNTNYTIQFKCSEKSDNPIKFNLCGTEKEVNMPIGVNHVSITTSNNLTNNQLELSGAGNTVSEVMVVEGNMNQYPSYFDGVVNTGVLQNSKYKIGVKTNEGFNVFIQSDNPLSKGDKLYWSKSNNRYEIDRNGDIEIPTVTGDVIDLPRLYQREDTNLVVDAGNIKPSKIKIEYLDID